MPKLIHSDPEAERMKATLAARDKFVAGFRRSAKGNLWRQFEGLTVTVFKRDDCFHWCIAGPTDKRFSEFNYEDEEEAVSSVASELEIGQW